MTPLFKSLLLFALLLIEGCSSYNSETRDSRTVYFGYRLGEPTQNVTDSLVLDNSFLVKRSITRQFDSSLIGEANVDGWPFYLYTPEAKYTCHLHLVEWRNVLIRQEIYIKPSKYEAFDIGPLIKALKTKYGSNTCRPRNRFYHVPRRLARYYWRVGDKAVYLADLHGYYILVYESIESVEEYEKSLERAKNTLVDLKHRQYKSEYEKNTL